MSYHFGSWWNPAEDIIREQEEAAAVVSGDALKATKDLALQVAADAAAAAKQQVAAGGALAQQQIEAGGASAKADIEAGGAKAKADIEAGAANAPGIMLSAMLPYLLLFGGGYLLLSGGKGRKR